MTGAGSYSDHSNSMTTTPSGLQIEDTQAGTGAEARKGQTVTVHYTGWLFEGGQQGA